MDTLDTRTPAKSNVDAKLAEIRDRMPSVYAAIQQAAKARGNKVYAWVRDGLRGEPDRFYAMERGRVVGTPFCQAVMADVAQNMVQWGCDFIFILPAEQQNEGTNGTA